MSETEKIKSLRDKILNILDKKEVLSNSDSISFYDISEAAQKEFGIYSEYFQETINKYANKINMKASISNYLGKKLPYIYKIVPQVKNSVEMISIYFVNNSGLYCI